MKPLSDAHRRRLLDELLDAAETVEQRTAAAITLLENSLNGHPRAARYDRNSTRTTILWCDQHQRHHSICKLELRDCGGTPITTTDPTGDAALQPDEAATALADHDRDILAAHSILTRAARRATTWQPAVIAPIDRNSPTAPDGKCVNCWRDDKEQVDIARRADGTPYYAGLCGFCGGFRTDHGVLPPLAILKLHHARPRRNITAAIIERHLPATRKAG